MIGLLNTIYIIMFFAIALLIGLIIFQKYQLARIKKTEPFVRDYIFNRLETKQQRVFPYSKKRLFRSIQEINDQIVLPEIDKQHLYQALLSKDDIEKLYKHSHSLFSLRRLEAAYQLSFIPNQKDFFLDMLQREKNPLVFFYLVYFTLAMVDATIFKIIMDKIIGMKENLVSRISIIIANHYDVFKDYLPYYLDINIVEHIQIQLQVAAKEQTYILPEELVSRINLHIINAGLEANYIKQLFLKYLQVVNHPILLSADILDSSDLSIKKYGLKAIANKRDWSSVSQLFAYISEDEKENQLIADLLTVLSENSKILNKLFYFQGKLKKEREKEILAQILSENINYIILKLDSSEDEIARSNLNLVIDHGYTAGLIAFINNNRDKQIEDMLFETIPFTKYQIDGVHQDFFQYIKPEILRRHQLATVIVRHELRGKPPLELSKIIWLTIALIIALGLFPILSIINQGKNFFDLSAGEILKSIVVDTNRNLIYFFVISYSIYVVLMVISLFGGHKQNVLWAMKSAQMLYEDDLLPPISIIAPAYNEEVNIITSIQSLLNLKYPNYEVIVINDGSKDRTLEVLIDHFKLKRTSPYINLILQTKNIRGIYRNREYPNLIVVNKVNGGKADALNVGINVSNHPYICGIDADSVLDQDALLKLMSSALDHEDKAVALGGNIVPANGCKIDHGYVEEKHFPKETLARFQAVEYLRSFSSGRIGWSELKSLLIISGAFGLFNKKDIVDIGGYITSSGALKKDSVGEDMELVVRLTYQRMKVNKKSYIGYIYHANCYTELPSDTHTLLKQRNRWHRGLIDILNYHRRMMFNPRYKHIGILVVPYFYIFEVLGPFFEWIGYSALIISLIYGFLSTTIIIMIFGLSVILGVIVSLLSLLIQESRTDYMTKKEMFYLMCFSFIENFGYRQLLSLHRILSFFSAFFESGKWGDQKRKGI